MGACGSRQVEVLSVGAVPAKSMASQDAPKPIGGPKAAPVPKGSPVSMEGYGEHTFTGIVADKYLKKNGGDGSWLDTAAWTTDNAKAEIVAAANDYSSAHRDTHGIVVVGDATSSWSPARPIWNQHAYSIARSNLNQPVYKCLRKRQTTLVPR